MFGLPALTARLLTPTERIALVKQTAAAVAAQTTPELPDGARMTVVAEIRTEDGRPLPANLVVHGLIQNPRRSMTVTVNVADGRVRQPMETGEFYVLVHAPGWAPTFAGPFQPTRADDELVLPPLILRQGFPVHLRITDADNRPLAGVRLHQPLIRAAGPSGNRNLNRPWPDLVTDTQGEATFANVGADTELEITIEHPGFQKTIRRFSEFTPDALMELPLAPAHPTRGHVTDADTGLPIAGAHILLAGHQRPETSAIYSLTNTVQMAVADDAGRFVLNTLNERWTTYVYVTAPGYAPISVEATIGTPLHVRLDRGIRIAGRVRAAAGQLAKSARITADYSLRTGPQSSFGHRLEQPLDHTATEPPFAFENVPRGTDRISLVVAGRSVAVANDADQNDLVIDLTAATSDAPDVLPLGELPQRKVVLTLRPPDGEPVPEGELEVDYQKHGLNRARGSLWPRPRLPVSQGQVELLLPAPNRLQVTQARLPGYAPVTRIFEIPDGSAPLNLELDVVPGGAIHGRLTDANGTPVPNWFLSCRSDEPAESQSAVNLNNAFWGEQKTNVVGGFIAGSLPFDHHYVIVAHRNFFYATTDTIQLTRRDPLHELEWRLPAALPYRGRLVGADGAPVSMASLGLSFHARHNHSFSSGNLIVTEADGSFEIPGINPAELERYELKLISRKTWQPFVTRLSGNLPAQPQTFTLTPGHRLSGRILDAVTGRPLPGIEVRARLDHGELKDAPPQSRLPILAESQTDADGRFQFSTFPTGKFRIVSDHGDVDSPVISLPVTSGTSIDLRLKPRSHTPRK